ncbi:uhrf1-binding protein 1-like protein [Plakobranchus ocellatus]|uniref:Uhrf1-binding protein 1-like protein n=1 Tax=Plakobranchus ocellatus TaxID=259542 RepID=A0AAV4D5F1_9GAST|nr:uhrf1-binding protein 1-like protein [Plakobranchus ocellatus]
MLVRSHLEPYFCLASGQTLKGQRMEKIRDFGYLKKNDENAFSALAHDLSNRLEIQCGGLRTANLLRSTAAHRGQKARDHKNKGICRWAIANEIHEAYLDEVVVETETCEYPRAPNSQSQQAAGGKYGFVDRVMDGIYVHVNSVVVKLLSHKFHASLQLNLKVCLGKCGGLGKPKIVKLKREICVANTVLRFMKFGHLPFGSVNKSCEAGV